MSFYEIASRLDFERIGERIDAVGVDAARAAVFKNGHTIDDLPALLSPAAAEFCDELQRRATDLTRLRFGRVVNLYAPLYLSNECTNVCAYCGFSAKSDVPRRSLCVDEAVSNATALKEEGFGHVLLVTGEDRRRYGLDEIADVVEAISSIFHSISLEVFPMETDEYARLERLGVDSLTLYPETYDEAVYARVHPAGKKRNYRYRLEGPERGGAAGFRTLGIGALLGLADWRAEAVELALHAAYLKKKYWRSRVAVSFPRIVEAAGDFTVPHPVSDEQLVQMLAALRLVLPDAEMVISTREPAALRDQLVSCGTTRMSAGSTTSPGGYVDHDAAEQFRVVDGRTPEQVAQMLAAQGLDPVWKDFDPLLRS